MPKVELKSEHIQAIDYKSHPAFRHLSVPARWDNDSIEKLRMQIDEAFRYLVRIKNGNDAFLQREFAGMIEPKLATLSISFEQTAASDDERKMLLALVSDIQENLYQQVQWAYWQKKYRTRLKSSCQALTYAEEFFELGRAVVQFSTMEREKLGEIGKALLPHYRERYRGRTDWRGAYSVDQKGGHGAYIRELLELYRIEDVVSDYKLRPMKIYYIAIDYSHSRQTWFRSCYDDCKLPLPITNYYHFDNDMNVAKMLLYLTPCLKNDGPFTFVRGSHRLNTSPFLTNAHSAVDRLVGRPLFDKKKDNYYRPLFKSHRDKFLALPNIFQGTTHFGDDLLDSSEASRALLEHSDEFVGPAGTAVLFDGYRGIHKGSTALEGERLGVQIAFIDKDTNPDWSWKANVRRTSLAPLRYAKRKLRKKV